MSNFCQCGKCGAVIHRCGHTDEEWDRVERAFYALHDFEHDETDLNTLEFRRREKRHPEAFE